MPKIFGKEMPPVAIGGAGLVAAYLVYTALFPGEDAPVTRSKPKAAIKKTVGETDYLDTDYSFQVAPLPDSVTPKDAFKPLVYKDSNQQIGGPASIDNYTYSGMAQLNGVANGLLENSQTGQGDFVQPGQTWHGHVVIQINADQIELRNDSGDITTLLAGAAAAKAAAAAPNAAAAAPAGNPMMVGSIGGQGDLSIQADTTPQQNQGNGRRRGGRRNRGGGGGGGISQDGG